MSAAITAVVGSTLISAGVGIYSANKAANAQEDAAGTATDVSYWNTINSIKAQQQALSQAREDVAPWRKVGTRAIYDLQNQVNKGPGTFRPEDQPGYQFGYQEFVEKPTLRAAAATGQLGSGSTLKALSRYAQDYASTSYDNWLNRYYQSLNPNLTLAGLGENAATFSGNAGINSAGQVQNALQNNSVQAGNAAMVAGNAQANNYINNANTINGAINSGLSNWLLLRQLNNGGNLFSSPGGVTQYPPSVYSP